MLGDRSQRVTLSRLVARLQRGSSLYDPRPSSTRQPHSALPSPAARGPSKEHGGDTLGGGGGGGGRGASGEEFRSEAHLVTRDSLSDPASSSGDTLDGAAAAQAAAALPARGGVSRRLGGGGRLAPDESTRWDSGASSTLELDSNRFQTLIVNRI